MKWQSVVDFIRIAHYRNLEPYSLSEIILFCFVTELHVYMNGFMDGMLPVRLSVLVQAFQIWYFCSKFGHFHRKFWKMPIDSRKKRVKCLKCGQIMNRNSIKNHFMTKHKTDWKGISYIFDENDHFWP